MGLRTMRASVVINTDNRCQSLQKTLRSLFFQTFRDFEVIVVNGPSTDDTALLLEGYSGQIKVVDCPVRNLSVSRNLGIDAASGDIVAFIDDDSVATQTWLQELVSAYTTDIVGGAGGIVYDQTGLALQAKYVACYRMGGQAVKDIQPPFDRYNHPGADPFLHLLGTNATFRRSALVQIGGFDEEYEYFLDETDLCMRMIDSGYRLIVVEDAVVHHKFLPSGLRPSKKVLLDPYPVVKNTVYFTLQSYKEKTIRHFRKQLDEYLETKRRQGKWRRLTGLMDKEQYAHFVRRFDQGVRDGWAHGESPRRTRQIAASHPTDFLPFPVVVRKTERLNICFACREYPPYGYGGNGRHTYDLAVTFAQKGHEVHVITSSNHESSCVDFEDDVWVHRLVETRVPGFRKHPLGPTLSLISRNFSEAKRIHAESPISIFVAPIWLLEGTLAACAELFPTVMSLMTTHCVMQEVNPYFGGDNYMRCMVPFEKYALMSHHYGHAISDSIRKRVESDYGLPEHTFVAPLCVRDLSGTVQRSRTDDQVRILFVGRIEPRKAVDVLLHAAELTLPKNKRLEFVFVGKDTNDAGYDVVRQFRARNSGRDDILSRVVFTGEVTEEQLQQHYIDCDIFCLPSRYESFGLVLLEAMSFAKPTVACCAGGAPEVVEEGVTGFLFDPENAEQLARKILSLAADDSLRESMGAAGRERFVRCYSPEAVTALLENEYRKVIHDFTRKPHGTGTENAERRFAQVLASSLSMDYHEALSTAVKLTHFKAALSIPKYKQAAWWKLLKHRVCCMTQNMIP
jgi:glycogen synthase